mmetsp:Transcript_3163/g.6384  ORF Transcript_3163/g.6384 Transcript_3163/m.6384 type:complete len:374 (+) Transcript_3163:119-1240(+)
MPFLQKTHNYQSRHRSSTSNLLYGKRTPFPIKAFIVTLYSSLFVYTAIAVFVEPFVAYSKECLKEGDGGGEVTKTYGNPDYVFGVCNWERREELLGLSKMECDLTRRLLMSVLLGAAIGWERRDSDRPAGIRTMSLVSLGACLFTLTSMFSFMSGPMNWDASRVSAAIPSGVGFLGAGLIWKGSVGRGEDEVHQVHGLTTAASVWLSAAVGVGVGGRMYFISTYCVALIIIVLRFGPRMYGSEDSSYNDDEDETSAWDSENSIATPNPEPRSFGKSLDDDNVESSEETDRLKRKASSNNLNNEISGIGMGNYGSVGGDYSTEKDKLMGTSPMGGSVDVSGVLNGENTGNPVRRIKRKDRRKSSSTKKLPSFHS